MVVVEIEPTPFAKGSCRTAHKFKDLTNPNHPFVAKFSTKNASRDQYFVDVLMQTFCAKWSDLYNSFNAPKKITFLPSFVLELVDRPTSVVCGGEPFIEGDYMYVDFTLNEAHLATGSSITTVDMLIMMLREILHKCVYPIRIFPY